MWLIPFLEKQFKRMTFIYVYRDPRDLVKKDTSFAKHDRYWLPFYKQLNMYNVTEYGSLSPSIKDKLRLAELWASATREVWEWCEHQKIKSEVNCVFVNSAKLANNNGVDQFLDEVNIQYSKADLLNINKNIIQTCLGSSTSHCSSNTSRVLPNHVIDKLISENRGRKSITSIGYDTWRSAKTYEGVQGKENCQLVSVMMSSSNIVKTLNTLNISNQLPKSFTQWCEM